MRFTFLAAWFLSACMLVAQERRFEITAFRANGVALTAATVNGQEAIRVEKDARIVEFDEPTFAKVSGITFANGTIEVKVLSRLLADAPALARGFIGVAFRVNEANSRFEAIYLRPTNGRAEEQVRRNRSIQYFSFPDYKFQRLRDEAPGAYETYADMGLDEWITMRIEVRGKQAKLFLNGNPQPALVVNDLKLGADVAGGVALWVDVGTEGFFRDLRIRPD